jgi:hypothetical protein
MDAGFVNHGAPGPDGRITFLPVVATIVTAQPVLWEVETALGQFDELVRDAVAGDRTAFASLLDGEAPTAYRAALAILRSPELAHEAVQEAAIRAWQQLPTLRASAAWPWWFKAARGPRRPG